MLDEKDLQAIDQLLQKRVAETEERIMTRVDQRMDEAEQRIMTRVDQRVDEAEQRIMTRVDQRMDETEQRIMTRVDQRVAGAEERITKETVVLMDAEFSKRFDLLSEGIQDIQEKLVPRSRVDDLEDEVKFLKSIIRQINEDVQKLKKAN